MPSIVRYSEELNKRVREVLRDRAEDEMSTGHARFRDWVCETYDASDLAQLLSLHCGQPSNPLRRASVTEFVLLVETRYIAHREDCTVREWMEIADDLATQDAEEARTAAAELIEN